MSEININGNLFEYSEDSVLTFVEGLIGMSSMKRAVLVADPRFRPFCWLASLDDESCRFIVVESDVAFADLDFMSPLKRMYETGSPEPDTVFLVVVTVSTDWTQTTFNTRAPIVLNPHTKKAAQVVFNEPEFSLNASMPE
ncbi:MAG: flagellar assembly protein FliW [Pyrinomonadaceae bacterium]